ncbi:hypothetical protein V495_06590 [Pseudogymnoascus sp. VKM F-4514 (FW-929)]|nr:hypothetical protein V490_07036 [Pseudogymnoascus sp. VKM F-3557]KFY38397.1 hypothetical protein V495_06590 [Pseudogymnoascus sp. VKM F-4514 (FW-929)]KFY65471.1 hypothetical protein V497_01405 [Pseudogymnoascus sp. VKM F-4516 (FW-969)]
MALQAAYQQYLATPNSSFLAENASLHYITTLTTFHGPAEIIKHLNTQTKKIKKKSEKIIDVVDGSSSLALETELTVEFLTGGGAYLPGIDDNFLADREVTFLVIHIVSFDANGKITQIRLNWDQGSLLKLIDVIGKTGRNWPIRDGKDQVKLIQSSVVAAEKPAAASAAPYQKEGEVLRRSRENSTNVTRDPHSSLALFAPRESDEEPELLPTVIAPRASAKPPPRDYHDLFVGQESENADAQGSENRSESPFKHSAVGAIAPKFGAGKNYKPSRIFDTDETDEAEASARESRAESNRHSAHGAIAPKIGAGKNYHPSRIFETDENTPIKQSTGHKSTISLTKPNPKKYNHFDIGSGVAHDDTTAAEKPIETKSRHGSSWGFDDFNTPAKSVPTKGLAIRAQDAVHWGTENDEVPDSPIRQPKLDQPRKDAETHFEFQDDGIPEGQTRLIGRPRGAGSNNGLGLYKNNLYNEDGASPEVTNQREVGNLANVKDRRKDFDPHFTMTDEVDSPAAKAQSQRPLGNIANVKDRHKDFDPHFTMTDDSPAPKNSAGNQKENIPITAASPIRSKPGQQNENITPLGSRGGNEKQKGIVIGGDGMGGKKGAGRSWGFGDDSDGEQEGGINGAGTAFSKGVAPKKAGSAAQTGGGDFWDF